MTRTLAASVLYTALAFAAGMVLGPLREIYVRPLIGNDLAILLEAPIITGASVLAWRFTQRRLDVDPALRERLAVGAIALVLLLIAEAVISEVLRGRSLLWVWSRFGVVAHIANVLALAAFFAIPLLFRVRRASLQDIERAPGGSSHG